MVDEDGKVLTTNPRGISVKIGEPLNRDDVAASIRTLYQTGDYADLKAVATPVGDGVRLDFVVRENIFFNQVLILGLKTATVGSIGKRGDAIVTGANLSRGRPGRCSGTIERHAWQDDGLYQAKVTVEKQPHPETHQLDVIVRVDPGPRVRLGKVEPAKQYGI